MLVHKRVRKHTITISSVASEIYANQKNYREKHKKRKGKKEGDFV